jgi:hypothetical protein
MTHSPELNKPGHLRHMDTSEQCSFQTENMKHKIRTVHRKKKCHNYKNIEPLENIHETTTTPTSQQPIIEGLAVLPIATFDESDWTEQDNIYEGLNGPSSTSSFSARPAVEKLFSYIESGYTYIARLIIDPTRSGKSLNSRESYSSSNAKNDTFVVRKYVVWGIALLFASIAVYNWAFLMIYKRNDERIELYDISRERLANAAYSNRIYGVLDFMFDIPLFFPEKLQEYFVNVVPSFVSKYIGELGFFALLFIFLTKFFDTASTSIRDMLIDILTVNMSNKILSIMYAVTFGLYVLSFYDIKVVPMVFGLVTLFATFPLSLIRPVFSNIFKIFFLMMLSVPSASIMCFLYLFIFSFFSILLLNKEGFMQTYNLVHLYVKSKQYPIKPDSDCDPVSSFERIINGIKHVINFVSINIISISYIVMLSFGIGDYFKHIKSVRAKVILVIINCLAIAYIGNYSYSNYIDEETLPADKKKVTPIPEEGFLGKVDTTIGDLFENPSKLTKEMLKYMKGDTGISKTPQQQEAINDTNEMKNIAINKIKDTIKTFRDITGMQTPLHDGNHIIIDQSGTGAVVAEAVVEEVPVVTVTPSAPLLPEDQPDKSSNDIVVAETVGEKGNKSQDTLPIAAAANQSAPAAESNVVPALSYDQQAQLKKDKEKKEISGMCNIQ